MADDVQLDRLFKMRALRIARRYAPVDSGNLRNNGINGRSWNDPYKFVINYSARNAYYFRFVNEGTQFQDAQRFIERTASYLTGYLLNYCKGNQSSFSIKDKRKGNRVRSSEILQGSRAYYDLLKQNKK